MTEERIPTELWVSAHVRQCGTLGIPVYIARRGASAAGTVMVKVFIPAAGCRLFNQARDLEGAMGWMDIFNGETVDESRADDYIRRAAERDPDVWVVEVEDKQGKNPFEGKVF